ncbi:uncharacterized protein atf5a [Gadus macrocephalus]|uniref:uncharacterized protein atf5a n=1 Tax=Gadus macrocephalus TaxID=80720 RepID=UPI0028CBA37F|nr:uncharacterized protein atf5a [Gadus macrocephalus]
MIAASAPVWKTLRVCPADPLALAHPQANLNQSQGCRGEVSEESQHLIGDGFSDWMTEEVDFSSYLPNPPSPPNASLPPSPLQNDNQVPSDLEVMTSLLQEELAQLEDYFLSEPLPEKGPKFGKCDKASPPVAPPPCCHPSPYATGAPSNQLDSGSLPVTLATGEVDLLSICGGPIIGRSKIPRHAPYSCSRPSGCGRKRVPDGARLAEEYDNSLWSSKGNNSGSSSVTFNGNYGFVEAEQAVERGYCLGNAVELRFPVPPREEKSYCLVQEIQSSGKVVDDAAAAAAAPAGFPCDAPLHEAHKKEDVLSYGGRLEMGGVQAEAPGSANKSGGEASKAGLSWKAAGGCYLPPTLPSEDYQSFLTNISEQVKSEGLQAGQHDLRCGFAEDPTPEYLLMSRESLGSESPEHRHDCSLTDDHCAVKYELDLHLPFEGGERKQKKRDQNKTAAHRYRQRKRAELDTLEEQLHGLEGRNRELRDKAESVEREIQYVKDLLIEVYKARSQRVKQDTATA